MSNTWWNLRKRGIKLFLFVFYLLFSTAVYSQRTSSEFSLDAVHFQNIDQSLISLKNSGLGLRSRYELKRRDEDRIQSIQVGILAASPKAKVESRRSSIVGAISASYGMEFKLKKTDLYLGYSALISYRNAFYKAIDQSHLYWTNFVGGSLSGSYIRAFSQSREFSISVRLPLVGFASRTKENRLYKVDDPSIGNLLKLNHSNLKVLSIASYFHPSVEIEYRKALVKSWDVGVFLKHEYLSTSSPGTSQYKESQNGCGVKFILIHNR